MQRIVRAPGGIKDYLADADCLLSEDACRCPFCQTEHKLHRHGFYERCVLLLGGESPVIMVPRLFCPGAGRTLSLLPDFCVPRRQHGAVVLGYFLLFLSLGHGLVGSLRRVRGEAVCHSVAQHLRDGFLSNGARIRAYLSSLHPRLPDAPKEIPSCRRVVFQLVAGLRQGFPEVEAAFFHHGLAFHQRFLHGLA